MTQRKVKQMAYEELALQNQRVQSAYEEIYPRFIYENVKRKTLALLIKNGTITQDDWEIANKLAISSAVQDEQIKKFRIKKQQELMKIYEEPDSKIPLLWKSKSTQPNRLIGYLQNYDQKALETYLNDIRARPLHYSSQFPKGEMSTVISFIEGELKKRNQSETREIAGKLDSIKEDFAKLKNSLFSNKNQSEEYTR